MRKRDVNKGERRQADEVRDRVGGGIQRSSVAVDNPVMPWTILPNCKLCWVHFTNGYADCSCECIESMLESEDDGS